MQRELEHKFIHEDSRGSINCFYIDGAEYTILQTRKGFVRGGCIHNVEEHAVVLQGRVEYHIKSNPNRILVVEKGVSIRISPETPHYFIALVDSIVLEWNAPPDQKQRKDPEFRRIVEELNASVKP
jgi:mannose-6-phosphate isomerase-like protein (cupin superfamily)